MSNVLVTGASGHLGRNLVEQLLIRGFSVKALVRNKEKAQQLGLFESKAEVVIVDLSDISQLRNAMQGIDVVFQTAANFSHWSRNPQKDIIDVNNNICVNVLQAAKDCGVKKVIYVSSIGALKRNSGQVIGPDDWIDETYGNPYFESKRQSEWLAWAKAEELQLDMVAVLPGAMIGGLFPHSTPTSRFINAIKNGEIPFDLNFELNLVDINDVCRAMINAIDHGVPGHRYILANPNGIKLTEINALYRQSFTKLKPLLKVGKPVLMIIATLAEWAGALFNKEPSLLKSQVQFYYKSEENFDISKSIKDLNFSHKSAMACLQDDLHANYILGN